MPTPPQVCSKLVPCIWINACHPLAGVASATWRFLPLLRATNSGLRSFFWHISSAPSCFAQQAELLDEDNPAWRYVAKTPWALVQRHSGAFGKEAQDHFLAWVGPWPGRYRPQGTSKPPPLPGIGQIQPVHLFSCLQWEICPLLCRCNPSPSSTLTTSILSFSQCLVAPQNGAKFISQLYPMPRGKKDAPQRVGRCVSAHSWTKMTEKNDGKKWRGNFDFFKKKLMMWRFRFRGKWC